jgi:hypothetical protein
MAYQPFGIDDFLGAFPEMRRLILVDYSFAPGILRAVARLTEARIVWCDHHVSAIRKFDADVDANGPIPGLVSRLSRDGTEAGCLLAWREFMGGEGEAGTADGRDGQGDEASSLAPRAVRLISLHDVWRKADPDWEDGARLVASLGFRGCRFDDATYGTLFFGRDGDRGPLLEELLREGEFLRRIHARENLMAARRMGGTLRWEGLAFFAVNASGGSSIAEGVARPEHDGICLFRYVPRDRAWQVSLYENEASARKGVDLSKIAAKYGGGGHAGACGFACEELPFDVGGIEPLE